jgi:hypothetical protein
MAVVDPKQREITLKLVYVGPPFSGKTTNLKRLHERALERSSGATLTLDGQGRTIFFDVLGVYFRAAGMGVRVRLFTVPGQAVLDTTRRMVLAGADGVVFVADSQSDQDQANREAFTTLRDNLRSTGVNPDEVPIVIQFNKRDLEHVRSDGDLDALARAGREPVLKASALRGDGVLETFLAVAEVAWLALDRRQGLRNRFGISCEDFLTELRNRFA